MKRFAISALCSLISFFAPAVQAVCFDDSRPTSKYPLKFYDNDNRTLKEISAKNSNRSLDGTGLSGTVVDCGDHWQVNITTTSDDDQLLQYQGRIFTDSGLSIILDYVSATIENENGSSALSASGGLSVCGPGVLYIDHDGNSPAVSTLEGGISVQDAAVVRVYNRGTGFAVKAAKGLDVNDSSLHVESPSGSGIVCYGDNENHPSYDAFSVSDSIVTVSSDGDAVVLRNMAPLEINYSSFHAVSATGIAIDDGNDVLGNGAPVYVGESVFVAIGGSEGLSCEGIKGSTDLWTHRPASLRFYDAIGIVAGGKVGVNGMDWITVVGEKTELVFAGNLDGLYSMTESFDAVEILSGNSSSGNAVFMRDKHASLFEQTAGHVTLFAPGTTGFSRGEIQIGGGTLEVLNGCSIFEGYHSSDSLSLLNSEGSLFYVDGIVAASKTVSACDVGDWATEDTALSSALSQMRDIAYPILSSANKKKTAVGLACDTIRVTRNDWMGGWMNIHVSSVGLAVETLVVDDGVIDVFCPDSSRGIQVSKTFSKTNYGSVCVNDESWPFAKPQPPAMVKVSFDANGGTVSKKRTTIRAGGKIGTLPNPTRAGFAFSGWFTAKKGGAAVMAATKFSKNATVYARWAKKTYKIKFLANGGTGKMAVQKMKYGKAAKLKTNKFKRKGRVFLGWSKTKNGKVVYANKKAVKNLTTKGGTVKLYAQWGKKVKVKFGANGGTVKTKSKTATTGKKIGKLPTPSRKNCAFEGWWTKKTGGTRVTASTVVKKAMTVYAHWSRPQRKVCFNWFDGEDWNKEYKTFICGKTIGTLPSPTREGFAFCGWFTGKDGSGTKITSSTISSKNLAGDVYACWSATSNEIHFHWYDGVSHHSTTRYFPYGKTIGSLPRPEREGYEFEGWFGGEDGYMQLKEWYYSYSPEEADARGCYTFAPEDGEDYLVTYYIPHDVSASWYEIQYVTIGFYKGENLLETRTYQVGKPLGNLPEVPSGHPYWISKDNDGNSFKVTSDTIAYDYMDTIRAAYANIPATPITPKKTQ